MKAEFPATSKLVSIRGGTLDYVSPDGEIGFSLGVPGGTHSAGEYLNLAPAGWTVQIAEGLVAVPAKSGFGVQKYGAGSHDTGANPDFRPTSASRFEREMRLGLAKLQATTKRIEARERALSKVERIPDAPAPEVIEPTTAPAPAPADDKQ